MGAKCSVAQSYPTLCDPMDYGPPGSSVHGISQERVLARAAIPFFRMGATGAHINSPIGLFEIMQC